MDNKEKARQLLLDLGEVDDRFIDEADTQIAQQMPEKKKISWSYIGVIAAAACVAVTVGLNLPERNQSTPLAPVVTDDAGNVTEASEAVSDTEAAENVPEEDTVTEAETEEPEVTEAETDSSSATVVSEYEYMDDIRGEGVAAYKNSDGTVRLTFMDEKFALTLPAEWENHFIVDDTVIKSKIAAENTDGKIVSFGFSSSADGSAIPLGRSGDVFWTFHYVSDVRYDMNNQEETDEYRMLENNIDMILSTAESLVSGTGSYERAADISDKPGYSGEIKTFDGHSVSGHSDSYILYGSSDNTWPVEEGWHVTAKRFVFTETGLMYDCYDTDDGDHYGWINSNEIEFYK